MKGFKAFEKGMICKDKQYAPNTDFEESGADKCCNAGMMHYCEEPFDCLDYYPLVDENGDFSEFAEVEPLGGVLADGSKRATNRLHIGARLSFKDYIKAGIDVIVEKTKAEKADATSCNYAKIGSGGNYAKIGSSGNYAQIGSSGDDAQIGSSGDDAQIGSSGDWAQIGSSGDDAQIGSSGDWAQIGSSGDWAQIGSSGNYAQIGSSGDDAQIGSSGDWAQIGSSGDWAQIGSSGYRARIGSSGDGAVIAAIGKNSAVKAKLGSWIVLAEYDDDGKPLCVKSAQIDGEVLRPDVMYTLKGGEFVEIQ